MQADTNLNNIVASALVKSKAKDVAEDVDTFKELLSKLQLQNLDLFILFLEQSCDINSSTILKILNQLMSHPKSSQIFGQKLVKKWLLFKIFEAMDILKKVQKAKRQNVNNFFKTFQFKGNKIQQLVEACWKQGNIKLTQLDDLRDAVKCLKQGNQQRVEKLFKPEQINQDLDKTIKEILNQLISDYKKMPLDSLQRLLQQELILAFVEKNSEAKQALEQSCPNLATLKNDLSKLKEFYLKQFGSIPQEVLKKINQKDFETNLFQNLCFLKSKNCTINVSQVVRLVGKTKESEGKISNKNVVLFIGDTGSGKSTMILKFLDYELQVGKCKGLSTLIPTRQLSKDHKSFYTSPQAKSCTRYINAVPFPESMYPRKTLSSEKNLFICDSPGFGDSAGVQVDIANGVGMINALHKTKSVRVVVILPYQFFSVVGRMENLIKISNTISKIFNETHYPSMLILFNKVPKQKIKEISKMVDNKIQNLPEFQKSKQNLVSFLKQILLHSKEQKNFVNPIGGDFRSVFKMIQKLEQINQPTEIQYQFTDATKRNILNFVLYQQNRIRQCFDKNRFEHSSFYLRNLKQLKTILSKHPQLQQSYNKILVYIQQKTKKYLDRFQQLIKQIVNRQQNSVQNKNDFLKTRQKIEKIFDLFNQFNIFGKFLPSKNQLQIIIQKKRKQLQDMFRDIMNVNQVNIKSVRIFSEQFDQSLRNHVFQNINKEITLIVTIIQRKIKQSSFDQQMSQNINKINHLKNLIVELASSVDNVRTIIKNLQKNLLEDTNKRFDIISKIENDEFLGQVNVENANKQISKIREILELNFSLNNSENQKNFIQMMKRLQSKCRNKIREIRNINSLNIIPAQSENNFDNSLKIKIKQIQLLMKLDTIGVNLQEEYKQAQQSIIRGLQQNRELIKRFIIALKGNNIEQLDSNLYRIKRASHFLNKYCQMVGDRKEIKLLVDQIQQQFIQFLKRETESLKKINIKLSDISQQTYAKIQNYYQKIDNYGSMGQIGQKVQQVVNQFRIQFFNKIKSPFSQFKQKEILSIEQKGYQYLQYILQKFQKFSIYALKIQQILENKSYIEELSQIQTEIQVKIKIKYDEIIVKIQQFIIFPAQTHYKNNRPKIEINQAIQQQKNVKNQGLAYLKNILKTLLSHCQNPTFLRYLATKINFELFQNLNKIETKLIQIKDYIGANFQLFKMQDYKYYCQIEDIYKNKRGINEKFGFKTLLKNHQTEFIQSLKKDTDQIREIIRGKNPSQIAFHILKDYYQKFIQLHNVDGDQKIRFLIAQIDDLQRQMFGKLQKYKKLVQNPDFPSSWSSLCDFLQCVEEHLKLQKELKDFFIKEHEKKIKVVISKWRQIANKIHKVYTAEINKLVFLLDQYDFVSFDQKLRSFGQIQDTVFQLFQLDQVPFEQIDSTQIGYQNQEKKEVIIVIKNKANELKTQIQSHTPLNLQQIQSCKQTKKLKYLFQILKKGQESIMKNRYESFEQFIIDKNLKKYYSQIQKDDKKKEDIEHNIKQYFDHVFDNFKKRWNGSQDDGSKNIKKDINKAISYLPTKLKQIYTKSFKTLQVNLEQQGILQIQKISESILNNPFNEYSFNNLFEKALIQQNQNFARYQKWIRIFKEIYPKIQPGIVKNQQIIKFIQSNLKIYQFRKKYQNKLNDLFSYIGQKIRSWIQLFTNKGQQRIDLLKRFFENKIKIQDEELQQQYTSSVNQIFQIYNFTIKIQGQPNLSTEIKDLISSRKKSYKQKIQNLIDTCNQQTNKPKGKVKSEEILDSQKIKTFQKQIKLFKLKGQIFQLIEGHLLKNNSFKDKLQNIPIYLQILKSYESEVKEMINCLDNYEFFSDIKKNMTNNQLQQDLFTLNLYCQILEKREQLFNSSIILQPVNRYNFQEKIKNIKDKFVLHISQAKKQIQEEFENISREPLERANILINQLKIIKDKQKKIKFMLNENEKEKTFEQIIGFIKKQFEALRKKCVKSYEGLKQILKSTSKQIAKLKQNQNQQIIRQNGRIQKIFQSKLLKIEERFQPLIKKDMDKNQQIKLKNQKSTQINSNANDCRHEIFKKTKSIQDRFQPMIRQQIQKRNQSAELFAHNFIIFQKALIDIPSQSDKYRKIFQQICQSIKNDNNNMVKRLIQQTLSAYKEDKRSIGKYILLNNKVFINHSIKEINKIIQGQDIEYVIKHLQKIDSKMQREKIEKHHLDKILQMYNIFKTKYQSFKQTYKETPKQTTINYMIDPLRSQGKKIQKQFYQAKKPKKNYQQKMWLLARIFAIWAILKSQINQGIVQFTIQPHPTQIVTLILLLGISHPGQIHSNRLAQVGTGEGKSIVLAGICCFLALVGYKVKCACYSAYLSSRDSLQFESFFQKLGIQNNIKYGTFNELCEDILNDDEKNLQQEIQKNILAPPEGYFQLCKNYITGKKFSLKRDKNQQQNRTILVVDQVDVFFQESFFGNTYCPAISLAGNAVSLMLNYVWNQVQKNGSKVDPQIMAQSSQFKNLVEQYPTLRQLLKNQIHGMIAGALNYKHDYLIIDRKIVYKDGDLITSKINYGYKTVFANIYQFKNERISRSNLDESLQINLMVAEFSYAILPTFFRNIFGVSGTLQALPESKKKKLKEIYNINDQYVIPSPYGINKKRVERYYLALQEQYYKQIISKIQQVKKNNRPIIIFFKGITELSEFANFPEYSKYLDKTNTITEEHQASTRDSRIIRAVNAGSITLMTSAFGRGTDLMVLDDKINQNGGLHVIQAFLSLDQSEQIQIKGRTARQKSPGSYDCIISLDFLELLNIKSQQILKNNKSQFIHEKLRNARVIRSIRLSQNETKKFQDAQRKHNYVFQIFSSPDLSQQKLIEYVSTLNKYPEISNIVIKTILGLDATGSMSFALKKTCNIIGSTFQRSLKVLEEKKCKASIQIQIKLYRNYSNSHEQILESTAFQNISHNLSSFLSKVQPKGGLGNEALEVFFQSLNKQDKIDQVILIGDAAPNTKQEVKQKRSSNKGQLYWQKNGFSITDIDLEMQKFVKKHDSCPVHSFYLNDGRGFKDISAKTKGSSQPFNINSPNVNLNFQAFIVENILKLVEKKKGDKSLNLVQAYRKMYVQNK